MYATIVGTVLTSFISMVGWAFIKGSSLNTKVNVLEARQDSLDTLVTQARDDLKELIDAHFDGMDKRLERIERSMNGHLAKD